MKFGSFLCGVLTAAIGVFCYNIWQEGQKIIKVEQINRCVLWKTNKEGIDLDVSISRMKTKLVTEIVPIHEFKSELGISSRLNYWDVENGYDVREYISVCPDDIDVKWIGSQNFIVIKNPQFLFSDKLAN